MLWLILGLAFNGLILTHSVLAAPAPPPVKLPGPAAPLQYPYPVNPSGPTAPGMFPAIPINPVEPKEVLAAPDLKPYVPVDEPSPVDSNRSTKPTKPDTGVKVNKGLPATSADPRWKSSLESHSKNVRSCQKELDRILARHGYNWVELSKDPKDRLKCEEILQRWSKYESNLQEAYRTGKPPVPVTLPTPDINLEELNAADIGR